MASRRQPVSSCISFSGVQFCRGTAIDEKVTSARHQVEASSVGLRTKHADGHHHDDHDGRDQREDAGRAKTAKRESDEKAGKHRGQPRQRIDKAYCASSDTGGIEFGLIRVIARGQQRIAERQQHAERDQKHTGLNDRTQPAEQCNARSRQHNQGLAFYPVRNGETNQWSDRIGECNDERVQQTVCHRDALRYQQCRHPRSEAIEAD